MNAAAPMLLLAALLAGSSGAPASAQGAVRGTYGDWELRCETLQGKPEQCILFQNVADEQQSDINLVVVVLKVTDGRRPDATLVAKRPVLRVIAPLGVLLPSGLGLKIESATEKNAQGQPVLKDVGNTGFVKCVPSGCVAEVEMDDQLVNDFRRGKTAQFIIFYTPNEGRGLPLALDGFEAGFERIK